MKYNITAYFLEQPFVSGSLLKSSLGFGTKIMFSSTHHVCLHYMCCGLLSLSFFQKRFIYYWFIIFVLPSQSRTGIFWGPLWPGPAGSDSLCLGSLCSDCTHSTHCHESSNHPDTSSRNLHTAITTQLQSRPLYHSKGFQETKNHWE